MRGFRQDRYGAVIELLLAASIGAVGSFELWRALKSCSYALSSPHVFLLPKPRLCFNYFVFAAIHFLPAPAIAAAALFLERRDPHTRLLIAAFSALAIGS